MFAEGDFKHLFELSMFIMHEQLQNIKKPCS